MPDHDYLPILLAHYTLIGQVFASLVCRMLTRGDIIMGYEK